MIHLEKVLEEWQIDSEIPKHQLDEVSRATPSLHAKYLQYLSLAKLQLKRAENQQYSLLKQKWLYYQGKMDQQTLKELGWNPDPFDGLKILKGDMEYYYNSDPEIQASEEKISYHKTLVEAVTEIVNTLKWRHATIKNMIDWRKFESGA